MFEKNEKYADELIYCKEIIEENDGKTYIFDDGRKIHLDKDCKICCEPQKNNIIIEKDGKYGFIQFFTESKINEIINITITAGKKAMNKAADIRMSPVDEAFKSFTLLQKRFERIKNKKSDDNELVIKKYSDFRVQLDDWLSNIKFIFVENFGYDALEQSISDQNVGGAWDGNLYDISENLKNKIADINTQIAKINTFKKEKEEDINSLDEKLEENKKKRDAFDEKIIPLQHALDEIEQLILNIENSSYVEDFLNKLNSNQLFDRDNKVNILMSLNGVSPNLDKKSSYIEQRDYYAAKLDTSSFKRETDDLAKQVQYLRYVAYSYRDKINSALVSKDHYLKMDKKLQDEISEIDNKISFESRVLNDKLNKLLILIIDYQNLSDKKINIYKEQYKQQNIEILKLYVDYIRELSIKKEYEYNYGDKKITINLYGKDVRNIDITVDGKKIVEENSIIDNVDSLFDNNENSIGTTLLSFFEDDFLKEYDKKLNIEKEQNKVFINNLLNKYYSDIKNAVNSKLKDNYSVFEPTYDYVAICPNYVYAEDKENFILYDVEKMVCYSEEKKSDFRRISDTLIYNDNKLYDSKFSYNEAVIGYSIDLSKIYVLEKRYSKLRVFSKDGEELNKIELDRAKSFSVTTENDIVLVYDWYQKSKFLNVNNGNMLDFAGCSNFKDGHAFIVRDGISYLIDKDLNEKKLPFDVSENPVEKENNNSFELNFYKGYMLIHIGNSRGQGYGYCDSNGEIVVPCKYDYKSVHVALDKYIKSKQRKENSIFSRIKEKKNKSIDYEIEEGIIPQSKNRNEELYELEDKIKAYLDILKMSDLDTKLIVMQSNYKNQIERAAKEDIEKRKNIMLGKISIQLENGNLAENSYDNYKNLLSDFIKQIEENKFVLDICKRLNTLEEKNTDKSINKDNNDELYNQVDGLFELYGKLNPDLKEKNIEIFRSVIREDREVLKDYLFRNNYNEKCVYGSEEEWIRAFRLKYDGLVRRAYDDYQFQQTADVINNRKEGLKALTDNKYQVVLSYCEQIEKTIGEIEKDISRIEITTNDNQIKGELEKCKQEYCDFKIDYNISIEENINKILKILNDVYKVQTGVDNVLAPSEYAEYDPNRGQGGKKN